MVFCLSILGICRTGTGTLRMLEKDEAFEVGSFRLRRAFAVALWIFGCVKETLASGA